MMMTDRLGGPGQLSGREGKRPDTTQDVVVVWRSMTQDCVAVADLCWAGNVDPG